MGDGQYLDIILFAMIAAFLVLRLRSVLGRRTGHERPPPDRPPFQRPAEQPARAPGDAPVEGNHQVIDMTAREVRVEEPLPSDPLAAGLTQIKIADPTFDSAGF